MNTINGTAGLLLFTTFISICNAKTKCVRAIGRLQCDSNPSKVGNVFIRLMDYDALFWEQNDTMGVAWSDPKTGVFEIAGCGYDFGWWNSPDPFLEITHECNPSHEEKTITVGIWPVFQPEVTNVGTILLNEY